jgi:uncharacterized protein
MGMGLEDSRVLLTGASGGLGSAMARELHRRGAHVIVSARRADVLEALCSELGERSEPLPADLADRADVEALPGRAGQVDVLVANAALPASGPLLGFDPDAIDRALDVNLRAPAQLARALAPAMVERHHGHLVFVSSLSGKAASPGSSLYSATKFGLRGLALGLAEDLVGTGVGVSTVFPGFIRDAGMFHESGAKLPKGVGTRTPEEVATATADAIEKGRLEVDVAPLALRAGAKLAGAAPGLVAAAQRRLGSSKVAEQLAAGQSGKS